MSKYIFILFFLIILGCIDVNVKLPKQPSPVIVIQDDDIDAGIDASQ
jgi:hypothetical protein